MVVLKFLKRTTAATTATTTVLFVVVFAVSIAFRECQGFTPMISRTPISSCSGPHNNCYNNFRSDTITTSCYCWSTNSNSNNNRPSTTRLRMANDDNDVAFLISDDPFVLLGLDAPTADKKVLKRAYKKRALKFHPDIVTDIHSTPEEKKKASDRFAKINGAYEQLMGKNKGSKSSNANANANDSASSTSGGWTPPHRRTSSYTSSSSSSSSPSTDWRDYMPDYGKDDNDYDTGGDSLGSIFSDLFAGAAGAAASGGIGGVGGGIFNEFIEFLEGGVAGMGGMNANGDGSDDADLRVLLQTGTLEEVAEEMDDTDLVVRQLETKATSLDDELFTTDAEAKLASKFSEKIELEERAAELKARKEVVTGYLGRARTRLLSLQSRYKDLITYGGANDEYAASGGRRGSSRSSSSSSSSSSYSSRGTSSTSSPSSSPSSSYSSTTGAGTGAAAEGTKTDENSSGNDAEDAWMNEGFGSSSGRSRGSGRRGSGRRRTASRQTSTTSASTSASGVDSNPSTPPTSTPPPPSPSPSPSPSYSTTGRSSSSSSTGSSQRRPQTTTSSSSSSVSKSNYSNDVPPHRRTTGSSFASRQEEDKRRMKEVKVDEEFEKLKKELGL